MEDNADYKDLKLADMQVMINKTKMKERGLHERKGKHLTSLLIALIENHILR